MLIKCDRKIAAFGISFSPENRTMAWDGFAGIWQSIQLLLKEEIVDGFIVQKFPCSLLWQFMQR